MTTLNQPWLGLLLWFVFTTLGRGEEPQPIRTFFVTRSLAHERILEYLEAARPELVQVGNYGAMFHGYADNPRSTKTPMMLPVVGERESLAFQEKLNRQVHELDLKVVGHFRLVKVMGDWKAKTGFVDYYNHRWPTDLLGDKPHPHLIELLQRDAEGKPIQVSRYDNAQLTLCLSSPYARQMLKAMLKCAVDHGVDGVITTYNYRYDCVCPHCQSAFKQWLRRHLTADQIREQLGIDDLAAHRFATIPANIPGYLNGPTTGALPWLAARWGAEHFKQMFDEIFIDYGRSLKNDLLVAQWNHLSDVSLREERMFLPADQWGREEDYFWYSGGAAFVGKNLDLKSGKAGDAWLSCLYVRELGGGRPFVMGKYDRIRLQASMAEGYATGGMGMGRYMRFEQPTGFDVLVRYTNFMHRSRFLYDGARPLADAALVLPRQSVWNGHSEALDEFRGLGKELVSRQVLLDVVADEHLTIDRLRQYPVVILPRAAALSDAQLRALQDHASSGGRILLRGPAGVTDERGEQREPMARQVAELIDDDSIQAAADRIASTVREVGTVIEGPSTVRVTAYSQADRVTLHLVNFNRDESPDKQLTGPELERPLPAENVRVDFRLPQGSRVAAVRLHTPELQSPMTIPFQLLGPAEQGRIRISVPRFNVYAVVAIDMQ